jgi:hypothetical protein
MRVDVHEGCSYIACQVDFWHASCMSHVSASQVRHEEVLQTKGPHVLVVNNIGNLFDGLQAQNSNRQRSKNQGGTYRCRRVLQGEDTPASWHVLAKRLQYGVTSG